MANTQRLTKLYTLYTEKNPILFVDDYGMAWYKCHASQKHIPANEVIIFGALIPNLNVQYYYHNSMKEYRKIQVREFNEFERNCNTCKHLVRVKHAKDTLGFLYGKCSGNGNMLHPLVYNSSLNNLKFHPDDHMDMICYGAR